MNKEEEETLSSFAYFLLSYSAYISIYYNYAM